ncbi:4-hydroxybenzoate polyprenyl transferase [Suillus ampliporus]|nr:4-hydroxybenzoate polyprenyl transferase [Suillus ampliporus]
MEVNHPALATTWVDYFHSNIRPYFYLVRADKPTGILLMFYPCAWSVTMTCYALSASMTTVWTYFGFFFLVSLVFRCAGCVVNDMLDKDFDTATSRTRTRPLAAALGVWLFMQLNEYSTNLGLSYMSFLVLYPVMKRITNWPQVVLGICSNWGILLGAASVAGAVDWNVYIPLYMGAACWIFQSDTVYARQDMDDDIRNGLHSTAIIFGSRIRPILLTFAFVACSFVAYAGILNGHSFPYFIGVALGALHVVRFLARVDLDNKESCNASLRNNAWFGFWVWAGALADYILKMQS